MPYAPRATLDNPYGPQVTFRTEDVLPPSALYLSQDDTVVLLFQTNIAGSSATANVRLLTPQGDVKVEAYTIYGLQALGHDNNLVIPPLECYLLSMMVTVATADQGSVWCQAWVIRGQFPAPYFAPPTFGGMLIVQGYVDNYSYLSWPNSPVIEAGTGAGRMRNIPVANTTGANWTVRVPSLTRWEVISVQMNFVTSVAAGNRAMSLLVFDENNNSLMRYPSTYLQPGNQPAAYYFYDSAAQASVTPLIVWVTAPLPSGLILDNNWQIQSRVVNLDAADAFTFINLHVREWVGIGSK